MSKIVAVPDDLYNKAAEVAAKDQVSIEDFVSAAVRRSRIGNWRPRVQLDQSPQRCAH